ncbi:hypothetical protein HG536_0F00430 [Torulaspora globosa]|uniref:DNA polymerase epsilon subunit B n=1 Tax=Torulaspora globosa TaxID=48254 RepID=A0A7G3ZJN3_9SACH|nr:uncharacterized protein HG536_0F00430 [Torulaspora globosa]QLL33719.1 hypothetical protein HG536_0F00430 [Torulaspora globosa]
MLNSGNVLPVKIHPPLLRPMAYRVLSKKYGLNIKSDGLVALADVVGSMFGMHWKKNADTVRFLETFALVWRQQERGLFVDEQGVADVVNEMKERERANEPVPVVESTNKVRNVTIDGMLVKDTQRVSEGESEAAVLVEDSEQQASSVSDLANDQIANEEHLDWRNYFKVINAADQAKVSYDPVKLTFVFTPARRDHNSDFGASLASRICDTNASARVFPNRFHLVRNKVMRNENFQDMDDFNPLSSIVAIQRDLDKSSASVSAAMSITQIKNLLGRDGQNFLLLGLLSRNSKGHWCMEDPSGCIEIDISQTLPTGGLYYVPGCIVLVEGIYFTVGNKFHVSSITHPPGEKREQTLEAIGNLDLLGLHGQTSSNYISRLDNELKIRLYYLEKELTDHRIVLLGGDIFLDEMDTMQALRKVLTPLDDDPPTMIVFHGSFTAVPVHASMNSKNISSTVQYRNNFDELADLISQFENIAEASTLVFVPGVNDAWGSMVSMGAAHILPQQPVPSRFTHKLRKVCRKIIFASNPARMAYLSQEIVIIRDDITERFKRHSVPFPMEILAQSHDKSANPEVTAIRQLIKADDQLPMKVRESRKLVKTVLDQGHLSPFLTSIRPIAWSNDNALTLHPIPSTLIFCDTTAPRFDLTYNGCKALNPGKFMIGRRARYIEYNPSMKKASMEEVFF